MRELQSKRTRRLLTNPRKLSEEMSMKSLHKVRSDERDLKDGLWCADKEEQFE